MEMICQSETLSATSPAKKWRDHFIHRQRQVETIFENELKSDWWDNVNIGKIYSKNRQKMFYMPAKIGYM